MSQQKIIVEGFHFYKKYGQIITESVIKKTYGFYITNIDIMIKIGIHIFLINCKYDLDKIKNFIYDCNILQNKFINQQIKFYKIYLSKVQLSYLDSNYLYQNNTINIYLSNVSNDDNLNMEHILLKLYHYISEITDMRLGLKCYQSDDIIMTYYP